MTRDRKKRLLAGAAVSWGGRRPARAADARQAELFGQIGWLKMEPEWVKVLPAFL